MLNPVVSVSNSNGAGGAQAPDDQRMPWFLRPYWIRIWNGFAFFMHFVLMITAAVAIGNAQNPIIFQLKVDRLQVVPRVDQIGGYNLVAHDALQLHAAFSNQAASTDGVSFNEQCSVATPNSLKFKNSAMSAGWVELSTYTIPKRSGMEVNAGWCVLWFFLLSFLFQAAVEVITWINRYYLSDRLAGLDWHNILWERNHLRSDLFHTKKDSITADDKVALSHMLHCNWLRFVEYSASGSLVLLTIAIFAGIYDADMLITMFMGAAVCMLLGIVSEFCLRAHVAMQPILDSLPIDEPLRKIMDNIQRKVSYSAWLSHILGWICILVPWVITMVRYEAWWKPCNAIWEKDTALAPFIANASATDQSSRRNPPDFVRTIIYTEFILYLLFGIVQLAQLFAPRYWTNNFVEFCYIFLSIFAKMFLGVFLFVNVLFAG